MLYDIISYWHVESIKSILKENFDDVTNHFLESDIFKVYLTRCKGASKTTLTSKGEGVGPQLIVNDTT